MPPRKRRSPKPRNTQNKSKSPRTSLSSKSLKNMDNTEVAMEVDEPARVHKSDSPPPASHTTTPPMQSTSTKSSTQSSTTPPPKQSTPTNPSLKKNSVQSRTDKPQDDDECSQQSIYRLYTYYVSVVIKTHASDNFLEELRDKYKFLTATLMEADENLLILGANPVSSCDPLRDPEDIPFKMVAMNKYFFTSSKPPKADKNGGKGSIWSVARISTDEDFDHISSIMSFDLEGEEIQFMKKRLQCFKTTTPAYFQFVDNRADPSDVHQQIVSDIGDHWDWTIFNKKPWEGFSVKKKETTKRQDFHAKCLHVECEFKDQESLCNAIRGWIKNGSAAYRFGSHIKLVQEIKQDTPTQQVDRTLRMNGHGRRFQASIDMVELQGLINPNGIVRDEEGDTTIRNLIISRLTKDEQPIFLSVTKKWGSSMWQATYVTQHKNMAQDFATCPAAWLAWEVCDDGIESVYKHFCPEAVNEAIQSTWDETEERMITPSEEAAIQEEREISNIPWLVAGLNDDENSETADGVQFQSGINFNFDEEVSIKTTRGSGKSDVTSPLSYEDSSKRSKSILRTDSNTVTSDITTDSRLKCLESGLERIFKFMETNNTNPPPPQSVSTPTDEQTTAEQTNLVNTQDTKDVIPPPFPNGEGGK